MKALVFLTLVPLAIAVTGCMDLPCKQQGIVKSIGQCAYSKVGSWGDSECVAPTERGVKVTSDHPFVVGETTCEQY